MNGQIIIPDISGFTAFVEEMDVDQGTEVIKQLLKSIIDANQLQWNLSEIEGDALLFYKIGAPDDPRALFDACEKMHAHFMQQYRQLKERYLIRTPLSLKFIVHYGEMTVYTLNGFNKLYGRVVVEAHALLKNGKKKTSYILLTREYQQVVQHAIQLLAQHEYWQPDNCNWVDTAQSARYQFFIHPVRQLVM